MANSISRVAAPRAPGAVMAIALMYHDLVFPGQDNTSGFPGPGAARYKLTPEEFREHLRAIAAIAPQGTMKATDLVHHPEKNPSPLLTFDDGGVSAGAIAEQLEAYGWRGHFFITTNYIGHPTFVTAAQLRSLRCRGHVIGSHSHTHPPRMASCSPDELLREWRTSCATLADLLGEPITTASVPGGFYSPAVAAAAAQAGIQLLFTSEPTTQQAEVNGCRVFGRFTIYRGMPTKTAAALAAGRWTSRARQALVWNAKKITKTLGGRAYLSLRQRALTIAARQHA